jgi:hypothetical protein
MAVPAELPDDASDRIIGRSGRDALWRRRGACAASRGGSIGRGASPPAGISGFCGLGESLPAGAVDTIKGRSERSLEGVIMTREFRALLAGMAIALAGFGGDAVVTQSPAAENFGGYAVSEGPFTFTGNGLVGTSVGRFTFFNNGLTATRVGNATAWNNGVVSTRLGRNEVFSNGVVGVPTKRGMVFTPGFAPPAHAQAQDQPTGRPAARHHAGHPDAGNRRAGASGFGQRAPSR